MPVALKIDVTNTTISQWRQKYNSFVDLFDDLQIQSNTNTTDIETLQTENTNQQSAIDANATDIGTLQTAIDALEIENTNQQTAIDANETDISILQQKVQNLEDQYTVITNLDSPYTITTIRKIGVNTINAPVAITAPLTEDFLIVDIGHNVETNAITITFDASKPLIVDGVTHTTFVHDLNKQQFIFIDDGTNYRVSQ